MILPQTATTSNIVERRAYLDLWGYPDTSDPPPATGGLAARLYRLFGATETGKKQKALKKRLARKQREQERAAAVARVVATAKHRALLRGRQDRYRSARSCRAPRRRAVRVVRRGGSTRAGPKESEPAAAPSGAAPQIGGAS